MRNLWLFLIRYNAFFWFVLFFVFSVILVVKNNTFQRATAFNSSNVVIGNMYAKVNSWKSYLALADANEQLVKENAILHNQLQRYTVKDSSDSVRLVDSIEEGRYQFIVANVANNSIHQKSNYLTLDKGSKDGVEKDMGVITSNGVVGIVLNVSKDFCTVQSLLHPDTRISVTLGKSEVFGSLMWGNNRDSRYAMVRDIPNHVKVAKGEQVYTSGFSIFPKGIQVGRIVETGITSGESFLDLRLLLSTNFSNLQHVYILKDKMAEEKRLLEETNNDNG
ncbi:rod shape-determining protein MreC [Sphingobacterium spiritivorum]|uniref:Cell shape-determining protein MreC n=1 Tax=Sphingobacterium spiritivorum ATCC 33861 TaxID=525373 RepID=D7VPC6_SPHSI|nr:rod shape-determining protein MreC [Sphingobacterium spiritivorum]EFK57773.1 rod shape-determining protein MreC [Sphingobacterium spiritivorum ATCC 33861]QQT36197.1 rod shape-determining protein MreC [Sphingobacterium spiritivorum]WQD32934.1 rod shape-determining protein MreC [Sphingobacterium spiritivorum]SUJ16383.1 rod shape-determining protein MreC [Sphingobacterium spiritivorum]